MNEDDARQGSSWALQGCLVGSVVLFVVLLLVMLFLAFGRFREHTAPPDDEFALRPPPVPTLSVRGSFERMSVPVSFGHLNV